TGADLHETFLTPATVKTGSFGKLFNYDLDGWVYAQPLYASGVSVPGLGKRDLVFVATEHDSVYALDGVSPDGANGGVVWKTSFLDPAAGVTSVPNAVAGIADSAGEFGITGTPVIDRSTNTLYAVGSTAQVRADGIHFFQKLYALDIS